LAALNEPHDQGDMPHPGTSALLQITLHARHPNVDEPIDTPAPLDHGSTDGSRTPIRIVVAQTTNHFCHFLPRNTCADRRSTSPLRAVVACPTPDMPRSMAGSPQAKLLDR
jgi:hypothetical protein